MSKLPLLIDSFNFIPHLVENKGDSGKVIVRGEVARAGVATENNRVYPKSLWEREIKRLQKSMAERKVYGEAEHPSSGRTSLRNASHLMTGLSMDGDVVIGEMEILNTAAGRDVKAILEAAGKLGMSSRGFGTTETRECRDIVQDNYKLSVFDFVSEPANITSYPTIHNEDIKPTGKESVMAEDKKTTLESLRQSNPKLVESLKDEVEKDFERRGAAIWAKKIEQAREEKAEELKAVFAENLRAAIEQAKIEVAEAERAKLFNDPKVAGSASALEDIKKLLRPYIQNEDTEAVISGKDIEVKAALEALAAKDLELANIKTENEALAGLAKEAGYKYHLESLIRNHPFADLIRKTVGDVKTYTNTEALNAKVADIVDEVNKQNKKHEERDAEIAKLVEENAKLRVGVEKVLEANKLIVLEAYQEERLRNHPKRNDIRLVLEARKVASKEDIDNIVTSFREKQLDTAAIEEARSRVRMLVGGSGSREYAAEDAVKKPTHLVESVDYNGLGQDLKKLRTLSGMGSDEN